MGITAIAEGAFSGMVHLSVLDLSANYIHFISPGAFKDLTSLMTLNLNSNALHLDDAGMLSGLFQQCRSLKHLDLDYNLLSSITEHTFSGLWYSVETLDLYGNTISDISSQAFSGFQKLRSVTLGNNQLSVLPRNVFTNLTADGCSISLGDNPLTCLPEKPPRGELFFESSRNKSLPACPSEVR